MPSRLIQLKDIDSSPNDLLFPITTGEAVSVTFDGSSHTLQSVVDLIPTADGGGGGGSTQTVAGKTVTLGTTAKAVITVNGLDSGSVALPASCPWSISLGNINDSGAIANGTVAPATGQNLVVTDTTGLVSKSSLSFDTTDTSTYLRHDGTWQAVSSGVSTHTLLSSSVHTDTTNGSPTNGNIIVGNGTKWTSQSFETFANTYHAVPLVGHFDTEGFSTWYLLNAGLAIGEKFYNDPSEIMTAASDQDSDVYEAIQNLGINSLSKFTVTDVTAAEILTAVESGRPVYIIADFDVTEIGVDASTAEQIYQFYGKPRMVFTPIPFYPSPMRGINRIEFVSICGVSYIGGIQISWDVSVLDPQNPPSDFSAGCGMIMLPRYDGEIRQKVLNMPFMSNGNMRYQNPINGSSSYLVVAENDGNGNMQLGYSTTQFGSDTTKYLRNDGQWAVPSGGSGSGGTQINWNEYTYN